MGGHLFPLTCVMTRSLSCIYSSKTTKPTPVRLKSAEHVRPLGLVSTRPSARLTDSFHLIRPREDGVCPVYRLAGKSADGHAVVSDSPSPEAALTTPYWTESQEHHADCVVGTPARGQVVTDGGRVTRHYSEIIIIVVWSRRRVQPRYLDPRPQSRFHSKLFHKNQASLDAPTIISSGWPTEMWTYWLADRNGICPAYSTIIELNTLVLISFSRINSSVMRVGGASSYQWLMEFHGTV